MAKRSNPRHRVEAGRSGREERPSEGELLLALDTATRVLSAAVMEGDRVLAEFSLEGARVHSERVLPAVDLVLREARVTLDDLAAIAVSAGPGSFTGLRVGIATVKGLAFRSSLPVVPVPTLGALRRAAAGAVGPVATLLDARRGELYAGAWAGPGRDATLLVPESVFTPEALAARLPGGTTLVVGEDAAEGALAVVRASREPLACVGSPEVSARASFLGALAGPLLAQGAAVAPEALVPRYLRRAEAEVKRTGEALEGLPAAEADPH